MSNYSAKDLPKYASYQCSTCSAKIASYEGDDASHVACASCNSFFKRERGSLVLLTKFSRPVSISLPIGTKGVYNNKKFQVVAALRIKESNAAYYWMEYVLKCDDGTYNFISEYEGHWNFVIPLEEFKREKKTVFSYKEREYTYFNFYKTVYIGAAGEFTWDVSVADKPSIKEYISPPFGLNHEVSRSHGDHWSETRYLSKKEVRKIFNLSEGHYLPPTSGGYSNQPFPIVTDSFQLKKATGIFMLAMMAIVFLCAAIVDTKQIYYSNVPLKIVAHNSDSNTFVSEPFTVTSLTGTSAVDFIFWANVNQSWMEASFTVINDDSGEEFFFEQGVEYYYGHSGGESWSEGNVENTVTLSALRDGKYRMIIKPTFPDQNTADTYAVKVTQGVILWSNYFILTALGLIIPLILLIWESVFDANKWATSNLIEHE